MTPTAAALLRDARTRARLSQSELARRAGITQSVISAYEGGRRQPALPTLARLVEASGHELGVEVVPTTDRPPGLPDTPLGRRLRRRRRAIIEAAERRGARNLRVFGSVARGGDAASSDVDLLVDLDDGVSVVALTGLERELAELLGVAVDAVPADMVKPPLRAEVLAEAIPL